MPPSLALLIGLGLVVYAFRSQSKRGVVVIPGLLWPTLWYMICASRPFGFWMGTWGVPLPGGGGAEDGSPMDAAFFGTLTILGFVILSHRDFGWGKALRFNPWIVALLGFMALSILWSNYPFVSFKRYIKVLGSASMALVVLTNEQQLESIFTVLRRCLYVHLPMSIICIKYYRPIGVAYDFTGSSLTWQGISTSKNDLGQVAMLGVLYFVWDLKRHWRTRGWRNLHTVYLLMAVFLLKGAEGTVSLTSVSVTVFAMLIFIRLQMLRSRLASARRFVLVMFWSTAALITFILVHSIAAFSDGSMFGEMITMFGRDITLTGRTFIWHDVYEAASSHPLLGVGFGGFWIGREANIPWDAALSWVLGQAHNGYIDTYLQIGLVGSALLAIVLIVTLFRLLSSMEENFDLACFRIVLLVTIIYVNATESTLLRGEHHLWFVMQLVIWMVPSAPSRLQPVASGETVVLKPAPARFAGIPA